MRLGKDLVGKQIISVTDGRSLGNAKDIYMNSDLTDITGIYLGSEGLIKRKHFLIKRQDVVVFGIDAILVRNSDVMGEESELPEAVAWVRLSKLNKREIDTPGGTKVANIGDIILGEQGNITGFALSRVYVEGPIEKNGTIPRSAVIDTGDEDGVMTIDLTKAENPNAVEEKAPAAPVPAPAPEEPEEIEIVDEPTDEPAPEETESETEEEASE
ncbi:PRC-barrel domain-containing protein [Candidatus Leptofilum sp.]|uniref:PRC-barrel domain-containing protein n=1 Tax=Candidatus Leptofilum sp. TaxID=3241576 RepID=UPI003B5A9D0F